MRIHHIPLIILVVSLNACSSTPTVWLYSKIQIPHRITEPTIFREQSIDKSPIKTVYESLKGTNITEPQKEELLTMVYKLKRNYFLVSKALQQCNLKTRYVGDYINKYNDLIDKTVSH